MTKSELRAAMLGGIQDALSDYSDSTVSGLTTEFYLNIALVTARDFVRNLPGLRYLIDEEWIKNFAYSVVLNLMLAKCAGQNDASCLEVIESLWDDLADDSVDVPTKAQAPVDLN